MRAPSSVVVHAVLEALGVTLVAVGAGLWSVAAGLVVAGVGIVGLSMAWELGSS